MQRDINKDEMYGNYIDTITSTLEEYTPISRRRCANKQHKSWFDGKALKLKIQRRKSEKNWHRSKCELDKRLSTSRQKLQETFISIKKENTKR